MFVGFIFLEGIVEVVPETGASRSDVKKHIEGDVSTSFLILVIHEYLVLSTINV